MSAHAGRRPRFLASDARTLGGVRRVVTIPAPAAGANWTVTVPGGVMWRLLTAFGTLTTSAAVANRIGTVSYAVSGVTVGHWPGQFIMTAGLVYNLTISTAPPASLAATTSGANVIPVPSIWLPAQSAIASVIGNLDVTDQLSAVQMFIEETWFTDPEDDEHT